MFQHRNLKYVVASISCRFQIPVQVLNNANLQLFFYKPNLWWPNGMGKQSLYNVVITVDVKGNGESDSWSHLYGFRQLVSYIDTATGGRYSIYVYNLIIFN